MRLLVRKLADLALKPKLPKLVIISLGLVVCGRPRITIFLGAIMKKIKTLVVQLIMIKVILKFSEILEIFSVDFNVLSSNLGSKITVSILMPFFSYSYPIFR